MLTFSDFQRVNVERCEHGFKHPLGRWSVAEWGAATAGEVGEACNVAKKMIRYRDGIPGNKDGESLKSLRAKLGKEIADTVVYAFLWAASEGINLEQYVREVFNTKSDDIGSDIKI